VGAQSVVVTGRDGFVIVGGTTNGGSLAVFRLDSSHGDLTFLGSKSQTPGGDYYDSLRYVAAASPTSSNIGTLTATGRDGVRTYQVHSDGTLEFKTQTSTRGASESAADSTYSYLVDPTTSTLTVSDGTHPAVVIQATADNGLAGASQVALSGGYVYVASH